MGYKIGLKIFRKRLGLSQDEIAEKLDCVKTTYQSWENGRREPSVDIIRKLFILGAKVEELFEIEYNEIHHLIPKPPPIEETIQALRKRGAKVTEIETSEDGSIGSFTVEIKTERGNRESADGNFENMVLSKIENLEKRLNEITIPKKR
jgi:transcriptional regulator with XRE-family HTH domain